MSKTPVSKEDLRRLFESYFGDDTNTITMRSPAIVQRFVSNFKDFLNRSQEERDLSSESLNEAVLSDTSAEPGPSSNLRTPKFNTSRLRLVKKKKKSPPKIYMEICASDLIEKDILKMAKYYLDTEPEWKSLPQEPLVLQMLQVAALWRDEEILYNKAVNIIAKLFWTDDCVSPEFLNKFIYNSQNDVLFKEKLSDERKQDEEFKRAFVLKKRNKKTCASTSLTRRLLPERSDFNYDYLFEYNALNALENVEVEEARRINRGLPRYDSTLSLFDIDQADITIGGTEVVLDTGEVHASPLALNFSAHKEIVAEPEDIAYVLNEAIPAVDVASELIREEEALLEERLNQQAQESQEHLNASPVRRQKKINYELKPLVLDRHNYWQVIGDALPKWFPGIYTVFPDSYQYRPSLHVDAGLVFRHSWRTLAPLA